MSTVSMNSMLSLRHRRLACALVGGWLMLVGFSGCRALQEYSSFTQQPIPAANQPQLPNPLAVPLIDRWKVMEQVSDELDNYFRPAREERIRILDGVMSEGWIETHPAMGSTVFEPWRQDSVAGFERVHATMQTVRRFAKVRVIPAGDQYQIDVKVFKELEDLPQPVGASVGGKLFRYDSTLDIDQRDVQPAGTNEGWIPLGRDFALEQKILANIQARVQECATGQ